MKRLSDILADVKGTEISGNPEITVAGISFDSRKVKPGDLFVAIEGTVADGHHFIGMAVQNGACAVICREIPEFANPEVTWVAVEDTSLALGLIASAWYDHPSRKLKLFGVTGTNGKSSIVYLLYRLYQQLGYCCGMLSTIENRIGSRVLKATHTTGDALQINQNLQIMTEAGCAYCFMEISSHAIDQQRIAGLAIDGAVFTNITHDHLDYHKTFQNYINAKKRLFDRLSENAFALTNTDDRNGMVMLQNTRAKRLTYSLKSVSDFKAKILDNTFEGLQLRIDRQDVWMRLKGTFNAYNLLAVYAVAVTEGQESAQVLKILSGLEPVEGRFQLVPSATGIIAIVDYAHTPDALKNVLQTIQAVRNGGERLITIIGAGGNRDKLKRPLLAKVACEFSETVILTADNPRYEHPDDIIADMEAGLDAVSKRKVVKISDRREAIKTGCMISIKGDILLVAGKGHETYQEIKGIRTHFDDRELLSEFLNQIADQAKF
jgi:UDP-N-acetylmuramoyl-L-alanyl-D-glutamate--2,6-diaminopimelate ligase